MAAKRKPARKAPAKKRPARRRPRKRNPKFSILGQLVALLGGSAMAGANFALSGTNLKQLHQGLIEVGAGALLGGVASLWNVPLGASITGGGAAVGLADVLKVLIAAKAAETTAGMGQLGRGGKVVRLGTVEAPLGAINAPIGGRKTVDLSAVQAVIEAA